jgi:hypothetical protein
VKAAAPLVSCDEGRCIPRLLPLSLQILRWRAMQDACKTVPKTPAAQVLCRQRLKKRRGANRRIGHWRRARGRSDSRRMADGAGSDPPRCGKGGVAGAARPLTESRTAMGRPTIRRRAGLFVGLEQRRAARPMRAAPPVRSTATFVAVASVRKLELEARNRRIIAKAVPLRRGQRPRTGMGSRPRSRHEVGPTARAKKRRHANDFADSRKTHQKVTRPPRILA